VAPAFLFGSTMAADIEAIEAGLRKAREDPI
jgi:hypothetical protein